MKSIEALADGLLTALLTDASATTGGAVASLTIEGQRVFVKKVPLTQRECRPEHWRSTRNLFELPLHFQYGISSRGFGAWRELAAHELTSGLVGFPRPM